MIFFPFGEQGFDVILHSGSDTSLEGRGTSLRPFDYVAPKSLPETVALLQEWGARARVLSGGTDLIVQVREDRRELDLMIDVKDIPELVEITYDPASGLTLGAAVSCQRV